MFRSLLLIIKITEKNMTFFTGTDDYEDNAIKRRKAAMYSRLHKRSWTRHDE